jgi:hypothetical protein
MARGGDGQAREQARAAIRQRLSLGQVRVEGNKVKSGQIPAWLEAWLRMGLGLSMIREEDSGTRLLGVIELLHLPARFDAEQGNLAGIALAHAAVVMVEAGDPAGAVTLKEELAARHPNHPVLSWEPLSKIAVPVPSPGGPGSSAPARSDRSAGEVPPADIARSSVLVIAKGPA